MNCANHPDVQSVAFCRTCGKPLCANCTRSVHGVIYCESCLAARLEGVQPTVPPPAAGFPSPQRYVPRRPPPVPQGLRIRLWRVFLPGFFPFGVGAVYTGQYAKGLAHLVIFTLLVLGASSGSETMGMVCGLGIAAFLCLPDYRCRALRRAIQMGQPRARPVWIGHNLQRRRPDGCSKVPVGALVLIGLGVIFLLHTLDIWDFSAHRVWPLMLIGIGGFLLLRRLGLIGEVPPGFDRARSC